MSVEAPQLARELIEMPDDIVEFNREAWRRGWGDGLPLIPPTVERVSDFLDAISWRTPEDTLGIMPPRNVDVTIEKVAINAVMAGCEPGAMPVLVSGITAMLEPKVGLYVAQATTHGCGIMMMVSGPVADRVEIHGGAGLFGPGFRGNASVGRAVRLVLRNVGGAYPGTSDRSTFGSAAKYTFAFGENEEASPWEPYRVSQGFDPTVSTVTVMASDPLQSIADGTSEDPRGFMFVVCKSIASIGKNNSYMPGGDLFLVLSPDHAGILADHGFTRADIQSFVFNRARIPYSEWKQGGIFGMFEREYEKYIHWADDGATVPMITDPSKLHVVVAGGPGPHSGWLPSVGGPTQAFTCAIDEGPQPG